MAAYGYARINTSWHSKEGRAWMRKSGLLRRSGREQTVKMGSSSDV